MEYQLNTFPSSFQDAWYPLVDLPQLWVRRFPPVLQFEDGSSKAAQFDTKGSDQWIKMKVLIPLEPERYLDKFHEVIHPALLDPKFWGWTEESLNYTNRNNDDQVLREQARMLHKIIERAKELDGQERSSREGQDSILRAINGSKRLALQMNRSLVSIMKTKR